MRLAALDLDGTLLRRDGSISAGTRGALRAAQARGLTLLFVTARPPRRVRLLSAASELSGVAICGSGSVLYDLKTETLLALPRTALLRSCRLARRKLADGGARRGVRRRDRSALRLRHALRHLTGEHELDRVDPLMRRTDALELCREGVTKLIVQQLDWPLPELLEMTRVFASSRASVSHSGSHCVEVTAPGVNTASALQSYCATHGIAAAEVIAFWRRAKRPSDAALGRLWRCGGERPEVLAAADLVTRSNEADGVALALDRLGYT